MMPSNQQIKTYRSKRITETVDWVDCTFINSEHWKHAAVLSDFSFPWTDKVPPETQFYSFWNTSDFFFRFDVNDTDIVLADGADSFENVIGSDRVEIFFSTNRELKPYYGIEIDPRGEILDYEARYHRNINWNWTCDGLVVHTRIFDAGYMVEGKIPLFTIKKLGCLHEDQNGVYLIAGLYRAEFSYDAEAESVNEDWMSWVEPAGATPDFHVPSSFGRIQLV